MLIRSSARGILEEKQRQGKRLAGTDVDTSVLEQEFPFRKLAIAVAAGLVLISLLAASVIGPGVTGTPMPLEPEGPTPTIIHRAPEDNVVLPSKTRPGGGPAIPLVAE